MMASGKPEQGATRGGAERPQGQPTDAGASDKSRQQESGPQGGYGPRDWWGGPGGQGMPPFPPGWGMPPGMSGQPGMYGYGMPPGGPYGGAQQQGWDPRGAPSPLPWMPWMPWMSWFMPWLGPWWSWLSSWFTWPGFSWMLPPFAQFPPFPLPPDGAVPGSTLRFAETRARFWRHWFEAQAQIAHQAANACYVPGAAPASDPQRVDMTQLKEALKALPEPQAALVIHAVQMLEAWDGMRAHPPAGPDW